MKKWLCALLALLMLYAGAAVLAEPEKTEYVGGVVMRTLPRVNHAPGDAYINVGYVECNMPYLLLGQPTTWQLGIEGGQAPYDILVTLWRRPFDATDAYYWGHDEFYLEDKRSFNYVFRDPGDYFWEITVTDHAGQMLVFQTRPMKTSETKEETNAQTAAGKVNQIIAEEITAGMSDYQRALVLHDWLVYNANYDYTFTWYEPEGVLLYGSGVCDSYARAYQMLCTAAGLECIYVSGFGNGGAHGWNLVKVDGQWYHVDCTWDDPGTGGGEHHGYFLLTDEEMGRDHDWNIANRGDMFVPDAEDTSFEGSSATGADFTFTTMAQCTAGIRAMLASGRCQRSIVAEYTGSQDIYAVYDLFGQWAQDELSGILGEKGWWTRWSASGNRFLLEVQWHDPADYVRFNEEKLLVSVGERKTIAAADYYPAANAFTWISSNPDVVTVSAAYNDSTGLTMTLTGVSSGTAVITATSKDGLSDSVEVTVMPAFTPDLHVEEEATANGIHLTWPSVPGVTEYHVHLRIDGQDQETCLTVVSDHEAYLTDAQMPANAQHEVWIVGRRVVNGQIMAEYCGEHKRHSGHGGPVIHTPVKDASSAPSCTKPGLTEGSHCAVCGLVILAQEVIPALGHEEVFDPMSAPTCTETGLGIGSHCSRCGEVIRVQEVIPALGHVAEDVAGIAPACTESGLTAGARCSRCGIVLRGQESIPALGHEETVDQGWEPSCTQPGLSKSIYCTRCGEILQAQEKLPALGHAPVTETIGDASCTQGSSLVTLCSRCFIQLSTEEMPPLGHDEFIVEGVPATHVTTGLTDLIVCRRCGAVLQKQETIPTLQTAIFRVPGMVQSIEAEAFMGCRFECAVIDEGCRSIGARAFADNAALKIVEIPASVREIDPTAFDGCSKELIIVTRAGSTAEDFAKRYGLLLVIR